MRLHSDCTFDENSGKAAPARFQTADESCTCVRVCTCCAPILRLENRRPLTGFVGSNPTLSATVRGMVGRSFAEDSYHQEYQQKTRVRSGCTTRTDRRVKAPLTVFTPHHRRISSYPGQQRGAYATHRWASDSPARPGACTQRNPRWFVPVLISPLPRVPTM
jgi:hypothetical protein